MNQNKGLRWESGRERKGLSLGGHCGGATLLSLPPGSVAAHVPAFISSLQQRCVCGPRHEGHELQQLGREERPGVPREVH